MDLTPWKKRSVSNDPNPLSVFRTEVDRVFDRFLSDPWGAFDGSATRDWAPAVDVKEDDKSITIRAEIAGVDPKDVDISISGDRLTIRGEKREEHDEEKAGVHHSERRFGYFERSVQLPQSVDVDNVSADQKNGVYTIRLKKTAAAQPKKIQVTASR